MEKCPHCPYHVPVPCKSEEQGVTCKADRHQKSRDVTPIGEVAVLGRMQFHSQRDLQDRFYHVVDDLRKASCVVDLWLHDLAKVMEEHGYEMTIKRVK